MSDHNTPSLEPEPRFVRYQSTVPHRTRQGVYLGVFAMVNTLSKQGCLSTEQEEFPRVTNRWFDEHLPLPTDAAPDVYSEASPQAVAWFKSSAQEYLARVPGYLRILDAHMIEWNEIVTDDPGAILYEDAFQVVASPCPLPSDEWLRGTHGFCEPRDHPMSPLYLETQP